MGLPHQPVVSLTSLSPFTLSSNIRLFHFILTPPFGARLSPLCCPPPSPKSIFKISLRRLTGLGGQARYQLLSFDIHFVVAPTLLGAPHCGLAEDTQA